LHLRAALERYLHNKKLSAQQALEDDLNEEDETEDEDSSQKEEVDFSASQQITSPSN